MSANNGLQCNLHILVNFAAQAVVVIEVLVLVIISELLKNCVCADGKSVNGLLFKTNWNLLLISNNGYKCFYHKKHIKLFIEIYFHKEDSNTLPWAIYNYVNNPVYLAGCRAVGIVDKLLTGPLWRYIKNVEHILDLNDICLVFKNTIKLLSKELSELMERKYFYPEFSKRVEVFNSFIYSLILILVKK